MIDGLVESTVGLADRLVVDGEALEGILEGIVLGTFDGSLVGVTVFVIVGE